MDCPVARGHMSSVGRWAARREAELDGHVRGGRPFFRARSVDQRSISGLSQSFVRAGPKSSTGRGMSGKRRWYTLPMSVLFAVFGALRVACLFGPVFLKLLQGLGVTRLHVGGCHGEESAAKVGAPVPDLLSDRL